MKDVRKTLVLVLVAMFVCSCGSKGGLNIRHNDVQMHYTISIDDNFLFPAKSIRVYECTENGDKIHENELVLGVGNEKTFTAQPQVKKVKVYLLLQNPLDLSGGYEGWMPLVYYLSPNETKVIRIDNSVELHRNEP